MKLRIIKTEKYPGAEIYTPCYMIQKKGLFRWYNLSIPTFYTNGCYPNFHTNLRYCIFKFDSKEEAITALDHIKNPFYEVYNDEKIISIIKLNRGIKYSYLNLTRYNSFFNSSLEFSSTLQGLKDKIDNRKNRPKDKIIY